MTTSTEKRRAGFKSWFKENYKRQIEHNPDGFTLERFEHEPFQYVEPRAHHDWRVWNAALDSVCVELPDTVANTGTVTSTAVLNYKHEVKEALAAAGIRYK